ncbi:MAG: putative hydroxymethylpyrimidine transporter CytX [Treponema sp.]|nr:putative hydroxymethylpyrimidine transporter CytX [Treponema sp.]
MKENTKKTTVFSAALIWFGAGVSIAEILTGTYFAPLGFSRGIAAILLGHIIGCALLFGAGYIGALSRKSAMETTKSSFGSIGGRFFALLNVLQLVGWTGIMIYDGAASVNEIFALEGWVWCLVIGALIMLWIVIGITNLGKVNVVAMSLLFLLTVVLCAVIFKGRAVLLPVDASEAMSFGAAVELAAAMPLSWLPLMSDYTKDAEKPFATTLVSAAVYGLVSSWMYVIGMGAAIFTGESGVAPIMVKAGLGIAALVIVILSTVTTTFLDAFSAGISAVTVSAKVNARLAAIITAILGTVGACLFNMDDITDFLYVIGSVFAPMIAVQLASFFVLKSDSAGRHFDWLNLAVWLLGFAFYRFLLNKDFILGITLPCMAVTFVLTVLVGKIRR